MPAKSKKQQRFMGMVHAVQKGEEKAPSKAVAETASEMSPTSVKHFAETKQKGLPETKESSVKLAKPEAGALEAITPYLPYLLGGGALGAGASMLTDDEKEEGGSGLGRTLRNALLGAGIGGGAGLAAENYYPQLQLMKRLMGTYHTPETIAATHEENIANAPKKTLPETGQIERSTNWLSKLLEPAFEGKNKGNPNPTPPGPKSPAKEDMEKARQAQQGKAEYVDPKDPQGVPAKSPPRGTGQGRMVRQGNKAMTPQDLSGADQASLDLDEATR